MRMVRFPFGVTRKGKIRNKKVRRTLKVRKFGQNVRQSRLRWHVHLKCQNEDYVGRKVPGMQFPGKKTK